MQIVIIIKTIRQISMMNRVILITLFFINNRADCQNIDSSWQFKPGILRHTETFTSLKDFSVGNKKIQFSNDSLKSNETSVKVLNDRGNLMSEGSRKHVFTNRCF